MSHYKTSAILVATACAFWVPAHAQDMKDGMMMMKDGSTMMMMPDGRMSSMSATPADKMTMDMMMKDGKVMAMPMMMMMSGGKVYMMEDKKMSDGKMMSEHMMMKMKK